MKFKTKRSVMTTRAVISAMLSTQLIVGQVYAQPLQAAKAPLVVTARAHRVPVPLPVVARAAAALRVVQAVVLGLAQAVQQVALVVPAVQVVPQAVQPEALLVV